MTEQMPDGFLEDLQRRAAALEERAQKWDRHYDEWQQLGEQLLELKRECDAGRGGPVTLKTDWLPKEQFEAEGAEVIGWLSSDKGFQDVTARLIFTKGAWHWGESEEPVKRPDLIRGCMPWPEPPTAADREATISRLEELRVGTTLGGLSWKTLRDKGRR